MKDSIRLGQGAPGIGRLEAYFHRQGFSPHRHDTYAIGITLSGVQTFRYRGVQRYCLPGQCHVLHPDELHDGSAATAQGFAYRIVYIDPALVQEALGNRPLPFVADPIMDLKADSGYLLRRIWDLDDDIDDLGRVEIGTIVADTLESAAGTKAREAPRLALSSLQRVRVLLATSPAERHSLRELERVSDLDRWSLARQFREAFGTSPTRFRTMRQLDEVRRLTQGGMSLAEASSEAGFADQSHMSRKFKSAYGLTPRRWMDATSPERPMVL